jgi:thiol-disulfide isomerase/thioredoxin
MILLFALAAGLLGLPFPAGAAEGNQGAVATMTLPALLQTIEEAKGKVVLINYFATWCPPCKEEIPGLIAIRRDVPEEALLMIGLSVDEDMDDLRRYAAKTRFNYPVWVAEARVAHWAGVSAIPHMVIFGKDGELQVNDAGLVPEESLREFLQELLEQ